MALIKKIDVKNYLSYRKRNGFRSNRTASQPDATGFSGEVSSPADINTSRDALIQSSASGIETARTKAQTDSSQLMPPTMSKSAQA